MSSGIKGLVWGGRVSNSGAGTRACVSVVATKMLYVVVVVDGEVSV